MKTMTIDCTTHYVAPKQVCVSRNVGKTEDSSLAIRFAVFAMVATTVAYIGSKILASAGILF